MNKKELMNLVLDDMFDYHFKEGINKLGLEGFIEAVNSLSNEKIKERYQRLINDRILNRG